MLSVCVFGVSLWLVGAATRTNADFRGLYGYGGYDRPVVRPAPQGRYHGHSSFDRRYSPRRYSAPYGYDVRPRSYGRAYDYLRQRNQAILGVPPPGCQRRVRQNGRTYLLCEDAWHQDRGRFGDLPGLNTELEWPMPNRGSYKLQLTYPRTRGPAVRAVQRALRGLGYNVPEIDGVFDRHTVKLVEHFQRRAGLYVNGVVDRDTYRALGF